jgi:signal peptide peptidase SppA
MPALPGVPMPTDVQMEGVLPPPLSYYVTAEGVGILPLHGPSMKSRSKYGGYSTVDARRQLRAMAADEKVGAILLHIDSPGGHVAGTKELADDLAAIDQAKPVHAYIEDMGASAAYWVASQARTVTANSMAMVGSLGTFTVLYDLSKAAEMEGVHVHVVSTGERKGASAPGTPVTDEDLAEAQRLVNGFDAFFRAAVHDGRELGAKESSAIWTGAVWLAGEAKSLGLVVRIETFDSAIERLTAPLRAKSAKARLVAR